MPPPGARVGSYTLQTELGRGGMGIVYRAVGAAGEAVAIKLAHAGANTLRVKREASASASLIHPNIVRLLDHGESHGRPFLVFELVPGARTLSDVLPEVSPRRRLELIRDVARGVGHAHVHGVLHRDLKPDNVLVDELGRARVADFGLTRDLRSSERLTRTGVVVGTPLYMAPEQVTAERQAQGPPTDVWALGVMLYEALAGAPPFQGSSMVELACEIVGAEPAPLPRAADVSPAVRAVCLRALRKEAVRRYVDGGAFADALEASLLDSGSGRSRHAPLALAVTCVVAFGVARLASWWTAAPTQPTPEVGTGPMTPPPEPGRPAVEVDPPAESVARAIAREVERGIQAIDAGRLEEGRAAFLAAIRSTPIGPLAYAHRGHAWRYVGELVRARTDYEQALRSNPDCLEAVLGRGLLRSDEGELDAAVADFSAVLRREPEHYVALVSRALAWQAQGELDRALVDYSTAIALNHPTRPAALLNRGLLRARALRDYEGAWEDFSEAIRRCPDYVGGYASRAKLLAETLDDHQRALADYDAVVRLAPDLPDVFYLRGRARRREGLFELALEDYTEAGRRSPGDARVYRERAMVRRHLDDLAGAIEDYERASQLDPANAGTHYNWARIYQQQGQVGAAIRHFERALELAADQPDLAAGCRVQLARLRGE